MRQLIIFAGLLFLSASVFGTDETVLEIDINGMTCPFCVYSLEKELGKLSEVKQVLISLKSNKARLTLKEGSALARPWRPLSLARTGATKAQRRPSCSSGAG